MSEILIFSDIHIHNHKRSSERLEDCLDALKWVFQTAIDREIKEVIFCGDLFHDRQTIDVLIYQRTFNTFEKYLAKDFGLTLLLGNHDLWHYERWDISSVNPFRAFQNITVIDQPCLSTYEIYGKAYTFAYLPYTHNPVKDLATVNEMWEEAKNTCPDDEFMGRKLLFGHVAIDSALWNLKYKTRSEVSVEHDGDMTVVGPEIFEGWDQVFLGHYHAEQVLGDKKNVEYVGSPLELSFGEAFQHKHIIIYDVETGEKEYIRNEFSPKHLIIPEKDLDKYDLEGNFVRLEVEDMTNSDLIDMRNEINKSKAASLEIKPVQKDEEEIELIEDAKSILYQEDEMLEKYVEETDTADLDESKLLKIGKDICKKTQIEND